MINSEGHEVPEGKIVCIPEHPEFADSMLSVIEPLRNHPQREELGEHSYHCLPVVVGNQYGFAIKSLVSWTAVWNGGPAPSDTRVTIDEEDEGNHDQYIQTHFGRGIVTIQNRFHFRTPPGVNLMVLDAPNYFHFNLSNLFAVVETDNLRRDFTFNLKIVKPGVEVSVKKGDLISAIIPVPRYFVDDFEVISGTDVFSEEQLREEELQGEKFAKFRYEDDQSKPNRVGKLYWRGRDADGGRFPDHQRKLKEPGALRGEDGLFKRLQRLIKRDED
jgi:hypothetical protein